MPILPFAHHVKEWFVLGMVMAASNGELEDHRRTERDQRLEIVDRSDLKSGAAVAAGAATKQPDGTFTAARIDVGREQQLKFLRGNCGPEADARVGPGREVRVSTRRRYFIAGFEHA
jgi:hypothetical protein